MRNEQEMMDLILDVAKADERVRAVLLVGLRANPCPLQKVKLNRIASPPNAQQSSFYIPN